MSLRRFLSVFALILCSTGTLLGQQPPGPPEWFPLPADQQKYLDEVLKYWEFTAGKIQRFRSKFTRYDYDPTTFTLPSEFATSMSQGSIQFAAPDKGLFKVEKEWNIKVQQITGTDQRAVTVPEMKDGKPQYAAQADVFEHWVCDGKSVFEFNSRQKQLIKRELPPEMQGKQIVEGPLPFLFGAKAEEIKNRYWIRVKTPPPEPGHFHLEAFPKRQKDAADFRSIIIVIDEVKFLPTALMLYQPNRSVQRYLFSEREINWSIVLQQLNLFHQQFYAPKPPAGWQQVNEPFQVAPQPVGPTANVRPFGPPPPRQAQSPMTPQRR
jgi:TIGR03009 family protein